VCTQSTAAALGTLGEALRVSSARIFGRGGGTGGVGRKKANNATVLEPMLP